MADRKNFGFEILGGRQIDLDLADTSFASEITSVIGAWNSCISCGSCTATCTAGINFRRLHYHIRMAFVETDNYLSLQSCLLCGKCQLVCPRGIPTRYLAIQIMQKIRLYAEDIPSV